MSVLKYRVPVSYVKSSTYSYAKYTMSIVSRYCSAAKNSFEYKKKKSYFLLTLLLFLSAGITSLDWRKNILSKFLYFCIFLFFYKHRPTTRLEKTRRKHLRSDFSGGGRTTIYEYNVYGIILFKLRCTFLANVKCIKFAQPL